jgi:hypothetical protein
MLTLVDMRTRFDFLQARLAQVGFRSIEGLRREAHISRQTFYTAGESPEKMHRATLNHIAKTLRFVDWDDLAAAWQDDDVMRGLEKPAVHDSGARNNALPLTEASIPNPFTRDDYVKLERAAAAEKITVIEYLGRLQSQYKPAAKRIAAKPRRR